MSDNQIISADELSALAKYRKYKKIDPFPKIPAALLNSADIHSYVNATGMIDPFDENDLKSASYAARIAGECRYWDEKKEKFETLNLAEDGDKKLVLKPNSIAFVGIEPTFRLPDYIALRFNLKITNVYRGLLLGTGPLIDPGFEGKITIPLHNLTNNEYVFSYGEALIWIEFTKTSPLPGIKKLDEDQYAHLEESRCKKYKEFPEDKTHKPLGYYLDKALDGYSYDQVVSSLPHAIAETKKSAEKAEKSAKSIARYTFFGIIFGIFTMVGTISTIFYNAFSLQRSYLDGAISKSELKIEQLQKNNTNELNGNIDRITKERDKTISLLMDRIKRLENEIDGN